MSLNTVFRKYHEVECNKLMILWDLESGRKGKLADIAQRKEKILREKISIFCLSCNIVNLLRWQKTLKKKNNNNNKK